MSPMAESSLSVLATANSHGFPSLLLGKWYFVLYFNLKIKYCRTILSTQAHTTFEITLLRQSSLHFFFFLMQALQWRNKTKPKKEKKNTIFLHLGPFPGIGYIQKRHSEATTRKAFSFLTGNPGRAPAAAWRRLRGKSRSVRFPLSRTSAQRLSQQVIQDHPSLIRVLLLLLLKVVPLYTLEHIVMRHVFPKRYRSKSNHV